MWSAYRAHHPQAKEQPPKAAVKLLAAAVKEHGAEAVRQVIEWVHTSPDARAVYLRDGGYTGLDNILRAEKLPARVEMAAKWIAAGSPTEAAAATTGTLNAGEVWDSLVEAASFSRRQPSPVVPGAPARVEAAISAALDRVCGGFAGIASIPEGRLSDHRFRFCGELKRLLAAPQPQPQPMTGKAHVALVY